LAFATLAKEFLAFTTGRSLDRTTITADVSVSLAFATFAKGFLTFTTSRSLGRTAIIPDASVILTFTTFVFASLTFAIRIHFRLVSSLRNRRNEFTRSTGVGSTVCFGGRFFLGRLRYWFSTDTFGLPGLLFAIPLDILSGEAFADRIGILDDTDSGTGG
jgi:hypothetical protein